MADGGKREGARSVQLAALPARATNDPRRRGGMATQTAEDTVRRETLRVLS